MIADPGRRDSGECAKSQHNTLLMRLHEENSRQQPHHDSNEPYRESVVAARTVTEQTPNAFLTDPAKLFERRQKSARERAISRKSTASFRLATIVPVVPHHTAGNSAVKESARTSNAART
jgi:hypothetical protein